jgi:hypothetical protein
MSAKVTVYSSASSVIWEAPWVWLPERGLELEVDARRRFELPGVHPRLEALGDDRHDGASRLLAALDGDQHLAGAATDQHLVVRVGCDDRVVVGTARAALGNLGTGSSLPHAATDAARATAAATVARRRREERR